MLYSLFSQDWSRLDVAFFLKFFFTALDSESAKLARTIYNEFIVEKFEQKRNAGTGLVVSGATLIAPISVGDRRRPVVSLRVVYHKYATTLKIKKIENEKKNNNKKPSTKKLLLNRAAGVDRITIMMIYFITNAAAVAVVPHLSSTRLYYRVRLRASARVLKTRGRDRDPARPVKCTGGRCRRICRDVSPSG